ncbi:hypothetical protein, variant [Cryptococcus amylolentus CBS 6039]|uniref:sterol 3beta-glucosyltransferase n=1 Tax=Cryptococcus amylolentus CBS 6039 TaxID=1295533 RepID=A0A1E3I6U9_9TREE|nr:hypothetical protein L202_00102 [Cryptococcus amylolentus CBS 6039]XP_018997888.1 hypothetical protein, variant [Cryptococcus amylolentus CBS 6039]ODN84084.1 hypothetical protein L202_00102 [Cryptococcus amylolentus CBS 6039]ODN84085.1 hypothetical protein, variant [Cryptococcus amylolentus CBS 6039]
MSSQDNQHPPLNSASQQPPFPAAGTAHDSPPSHTQQVAQSLVNTVAQHTIPTEPPTAEERGQSPSDSQPNPGVADSEAPMGDIMKSDSPPPDDIGLPAVEPPQSQSREVESITSPAISYAPKDQASEGWHAKITPEPTSISSGYEAQPDLSDMGPPIVPPGSDSQGVRFSASSPISYAPREPLPEGQTLEDTASDTGPRPNYEARPGFGISKEIGSIRMGASALVSALNALPWDDEDEEGDEEENDDLAPSVPGRGSASVMQETVRRPKLAKLGSSLHTIRPLSNPATPLPTPYAHPSHSLHFPFRQNAIARKARRPGTTELDYQFAASPPRSGHERQGSIASEVSSDGEVPLPKGFKQSKRESSDSSVGSITGEEADMLNARITQEQGIADEEERVEMLETAREEGVSEIELGKAISTRGSLQDLNAAAALSTRGSLQDLNTAAALREENHEGEDVIAESLETDESEKRLMRKERLAERLMEVFGLEEREEVLAEMKCWLLRCVMLKGYMYLTKRHICFFANMPDENNLLVKSGPLYKKASRTKLNTKFWVVLKNDVLSWYESTSDPYFPKGNISLQYCISVDPVRDTKFKIRTAERSYTFTADTEGGRDEWVKVVKKVMFKLQHEGETIKVIIPFQAVIDVEKSPTLEFAETIEVKCMDAEDKMSIDSYFFASFPDNDYAFEILSQLIRDRSPDISRTSSADIPRISSAATITVGQESLDTSYATLKTLVDKPASPSPTESLPQPIKKLSSVLKPLVSKTGDEEAASQEDAPSQSTSDTTGTSFDGYPPAQVGPPPASMLEDKSTWGPSWIRKPAAKIFGSSPSGSISSYLGRSPTDSLTTVVEGPRARLGRGKQHSVTEVVEAPLRDLLHDTEDEGSDDEFTGHTSRNSSFQSAAEKRASRSSWTSESSTGSQMVHSRSDFSMLGSDNGHSESAEMVKKFRSFFALSEKEELLDHFPGYLYRVLPISGRFFVSTNYFCFRSSQLLYKTKMIIPIRDLYGLKAQKAFRFGHSGLIIVIKGHEELFLEFSNSDRRKACISILEERMETVRLSVSSGQTPPDQNRIKAHIMEDLDESHPIEAGTPLGSGMSSPSPMFGSATSTSFLEFKPESMRITCLTIGSRGDVQPYIALCKGLQAEGHRTKIATHGEYKDWVEGHGIEFESVGGDPAELMQMCVDNGMFTVSFLKEGLQKFRGWLDDLLNSSWQACQGSDLLIESPSAMSGFHIAEALRIPYYRAFTMPWTRTRAYPHAFAVPESRRGGSYNYMTYTMFDQVFWRAISSQINRWRRHELSLDNTTFDKMEQHKVPFLYNFSPTVVPAPLDWTEWIHVTGYWFLDKPDEKEGDTEKKWCPPDGLVEFIDGAHANGKKVVYIGFGSIVVSDPEEMTRCVVEAVISSGVHAILSKGWSDRGTKARGEPSGGAEGADGVKYPPEIFAIDSIDHGWLFPKIDAACHHGGAGTTGASLRAGIPTIIKPFFGDQAFWAERVESLNVGSAIRKLDSEQLAKALVKATSDEKQIAKAKDVGEVVRRENGVARAIEAIYRDLEYAKSIIKPPPASAVDDKEDNLNRVSSLLHPLTSPDLSKNIRSRSRSHSRSHSKSHSSSFSHTASPRRASISSLLGAGGDEEEWSVIPEGAGMSRSGSLSPSAGVRGSPEKRGSMGLGMGAVLGREVLRGAAGLPLPNPFGKWRSGEE